jgi:hypothetical protein
MIRFCLLLVCMFASVVFSVVAEVPTVLATRIVKEPAKEVVLVSENSEPQVGTLKYEPNVFSDVSSNPNLSQNVAAVTVPGEALVEPAKDAAKSVYPIFAGTFNNNVERLAELLGFSPVIWDERVKNCIWEQVTEYDVPSKYVEARDVLAFYASTLDFKPAYSEVDTSVQLIYVGALSRIQDCQND